MPIDEKKLLQKLKDKDREINELKQLLAEAEHEIKELNDFHGFQKPRPSILESQFLNKLIKRAAFLLIIAVIIFIGVYPWLFKDKILDSQPATDQQFNLQSETKNIVDSAATQQPKSTSQSTATTTPSSQDNKPVSGGENGAEPSKLLIVKSDLGWLNVRTEPSVENGQIIKKINSEEEIEWLEKTDNNWYKIKLDAQGHTGYVSGEYVEIK